VRKWLRINLTPIAHDADVSVETWLAKCANYTEARREELFVKWSELGRDVDEDDYCCSSFVKREEYPCYKEARLINSRSDVFKCMTGPYFRLIEEELYKLPYFIKHVPVPERPEYISNMLQGSGTFVATDHTAFEAHISTNLMLACEMQLYRYMLRDLPGGREVLGHIRYALTGVQQCEFVSGCVNVVGARMSGDMCTSLGNGFTNLMAFLYCAHRHSLGREATVTGVVEGDDGLFLCKGFLPTAGDFAELGLKIKIETHEQLETASFCGLIFHKEVRQNIADPIDRILSSGWSLSNLRFSTPATMLELSRGKALSLAYELPGCPMVQAMCRWLLRATNNASPKFGGMHGRHDWWSEQLGIQGNRLRPDIEKILFSPVDMRNRVLVCELFGVTISEQLALEHWCDQQSEIRPIPLDLIAAHVHQDCVTYFQTNYVLERAGVADRKQYL
jgi:hypothetical protein